MTTAHADTRGRKRGRKPPRRGSRALAATESLPLSTCKVCIFLSFGARGSTKVRFNGADGQPDNRSLLNAMNRSGRSAESSAPVLTAFVSWAHTDNAWGPTQAVQWRQTVLDFATALRRFGGVDADLDLWHTAGHTNWSTFGVSGVRDSDFILIAVSSAYRERWEESGSPREGAGAAREANAIKSIFDRDRAEFRRRVKVILLQDATIDDIPMELLPSTERFRIRSFVPPGADRASALATRAAGTAQPAGWSCTGATARLRRRCLGRDGRACRRGRYAGMSGPTHRG